MSLERHDDGRVTPVNGDYEMTSVRLGRTHDVFLVPEREADSAQRDDLETRAVRSLDDALRLLGSDA